MEIDTDLLRQYGRDCDNSAAGVGHARSYQNRHSVIPPTSWQGGNLVLLFQLQSALDDMRGSYERVRERILERMSAIAEDLGDTAETISGCPR
jgi:hypothetical protein